MNLRIVIAGSRDFKDYDFLKEKMFPIISRLRIKGYNVIIVSGKANGADTLGEKFAEELGLDIEEYPADWDRYQKSAGFIRNEQMAKVAHLVVVFWDGKSEGTKHMMNLAVKHKKKLRVFKFKLNK